LNVRRGQAPLVRLAGEPAIVTVDIQTNGVSIGAGNCGFMTGDVNRLVQPGEGAVTWMSNKAWPGHVIDEPCVTAVVTAWATNSPPDYFVQNLADWSDKAWYVSAEAVPGGVTNDIYKTQRLLLRRIPAAEVTWSMGSPLSEPGRTEAETQRQVVLSRDYYMAVYELTKRQWQLVKGKRHDCKFKNEACWATRPVDNVTYTEVRGTGSNWPTTADVGNDAFLWNLRTQSGLAGFDLPTEAQWEFACRAGSEYGLYTGEDITATDSACPRLDVLGRYGDNGGYLSGETKPDPDTCTTANGTDKVGSYAPNAFGLYDMLGNVQELCRDRYAKAWSETGNPVRDPKGATSGDNVPQRGGGCYSHPKDCRCARRASFSKTGNGATSGFRVCLEL